MEQMHALEPWPDCACHYKDSPKGDEKPIHVFGFSHLIWLSMIALAILGAADTVSMVIRISLVQLATPDAMRGRVGAVNFLFVNTSYQLGEFESGMTAALFGAMPAAVLGGLGTIAVALLWMKIFPTLRKVQRLE